MTAKDFFDFAKKNCHVAKTAAETRQHGAFAAPEIQSPSWVDSVREIEQQRQPLPEDPADQGIGVRIDPLLD